MNPSKFCDFAAQAAVAGVYAIVASIGIGLFTGADGATTHTSSSDLLGWEHADVAVFKEGFLNVDRAYTTRTRIIAEKRLSRIEHATIALDPVEFAVELCRVAALADNAHTSCVSNALAREICRQLGVSKGVRSTGCAVGAPDFIVPEFNKVPLRLFPFGEAFNVVGVKTADSDLLGARIVSVDGRTVASIRSTLRTFHGGTNAMRDLVAADVMVSPDQMHAVSISRRNTMATYRFLTPNGLSIERTFNAEADDRTGEWKQIPSPANAPWSFQDPGKPFRWRDMPALDAIVIQLRQIADAADQKIADFLETAESNRERLGRRNIVLDMRFNGGGNFLLTRDFMIRWPARVPAPGRFFVLTSRQTFSAAITSVAYLKQAGTNRVVLVGEAPGDRLMFFSEGLPIQLPHSGLFFRPAAARIDCHSGCREYDDCFWAVAQPGRPAAPLTVPAGEKMDRIPIAISSLDPDISAPWTVESWLSGKDPAVDAVFAAASRSLRTQ